MTQIKDVKRCERCNAPAGENAELRLCPECGKKLCPACWGMGSKYPDNECTVCEEEKWG